MKRLNWMASAAIAMCLGIGALAPARAAHNDSLLQLTWKMPSATAMGKLASELKPLAASYSAVAPAGAAWAKVEGNQLLVKVLIVAASGDAELPALRADVIGRGGSVYYNYLSVRAIAAMLPAAALGAIAARADVVAISPNRVALRQASLLQETSAAGSMLPGAGTPSAFDGRGVTIAVLDSGIDYRHRDFQAADGSSRVRAVMDIVSLGRSLYGDGWKRGVDASATVKGFIDGKKYKPDDDKLRPKAAVPDAYGHGTAVAAVAAGAGSYQSPDSSGIAPGAGLVDVRVLDDRGVGNLADVLLGIDWVVQRAKLANIRVMNLSLGAASTDSFLKDPLARAARSAVACGIVVVTSAGNAGRDESGREVLGIVSSPANEPSVIAVGAANTFGSITRTDDAVAGFSSRGPSRGGFGFASGNVWTDDLIKPDLVAPGNRLLTAMSTNAAGNTNGWNLLARSYPQLAEIPGATQAPRRTLLTMSGTSVAAPAVAGAAAVLLQANPGLTPPLVKAILQYTATPLAAANVLQQGTGMLNLEGALRVARALRTDIAPALAAGALKAGDALLAPGMAMPLPRTTVAGRILPWSRMVLAGGTHLVSGDALFTRWQPVWDPKLTWARNVVLRTTIAYAPADAKARIPAATVPMAIGQGSAGAQPLLTAGVRLLDATAGHLGGDTAALLAPLTVLQERADAGAGTTLRLGFRSTGSGISAEGCTLSQGFVFGEGDLLAEGTLLSEGYLLSEGFVLSEGFRPSRGFVLAEGYLLAEGFILNEGFLLRESVDPAAAADDSLVGE